ncbi:MAG: hypothetical protein AB7O44_09805 [Hyphomicrobiaceae bacterium]
MSRKAAKYPAVHGYAGTRSLPDVLSSIENDFKTWLTEHPEGLDEVAQLFLRDTLRRLRNDRSAWDGAYE